MKSGSASDVLIVFARHPEWGKVKTRLAASAGEAKALSVYKKLLDHTWQITEGLLCRKIVYYDTGIIDDDIWSDKFEKASQRGDDLGERMSNAFADLNFKKAIIIGTDCPELTSEQIKSAFDHLDSNDVVIGPAHDGGYYLLGMRHFYPALFTGIKWSTGTVLWRTIDKCLQLNLKVQQLATLHDIDEECDLIYLNPGRT